MSEPILVLSHNVALSGLIARTLRWREVYSTILPVSTPLCPAGAFLFEG